jgi:hypothetical protein
MLPSAADVARNIKSAFGPQKEPDDSDNVILTFVMRGGVLVNIDTMTKKEAEDFVRAFAVYKDQMRKRHPVVYKGKVMSTMPKIEYTMPEKPRWAVDYNEVVAVYWNRMDIK